MEILKQLLKSINDKEEVAALLIKGFSPREANVIETKVPDGKLWIVRPLISARFSNQAFITLVEDKKDHSLKLSIRINDGSSTTFNHTASYVFTEKDDQFFSLFVLINKNCLLR